MGRRVKKSVEDANGAGYNMAVVTNFVYDGWNLLAELDGGNNNAVVCSYMWGPDLSGSLQGAGGVGGLLTVSPGATTTHFSFYDGNGNVAGMTDSAGRISARYEYSPFGETIRASGSAANLNPIRFSTKYADLESGFAYYGYRFYAPSIGSWLGREPLGDYVTFRNSAAAATSEDAEALQAAALSPAYGFTYNASQNLVDKKRPRNLHRSWNPPLDSGQAGAGPTNPGSSAPPYRRQGSAWCQHRNRGQMRRRDPLWSWA